MKHLSLVAFMLLIACNVTAQTNEKCGSTIQVHELRMETDPEYRRHVEEWRKKVDPIIQERRTQKNPTCANGPILVPIAVHFGSNIVNGASEEACAISVVEDQIAELNAEMAGMDSDASLINNFTACFGANILGDACIEFCLANANHPSGYGLVDGDPAVTFDQVNFSLPAGAGSPINADWAGYVNVYVYNLGGGILGESNGIPGNFNGDGVRVHHCVFGTGNITCSGIPLTGTCSGYGLFDEGETLAHEIGHYFGLYHIWGDNGLCSGAQDQIPDTPNMSMSYNGYTACTNHNNCSDLPQTCGSEDMYMNFMSYVSDGCMYMFTSDQSDVMYATAVAEGYTTSSTYCSDPSPVADFSPSGNIDLCVDLSINFTDLSTNNPTAWDWTFNVIAGNITLDTNSATSQNPIVTVTGGTSGTIETELTATNAGGSDSVIKNQIVTVLTTRTYYEDNDGDMFGNANSTTIDCTAPPGFVLDNTDCDDNDPDNYPGNTEVCDGSDNNCNGLVDDDDPGVVAPLWYRDEDGDLFGDISIFQQQCAQPAGFVADNTDCDDNDPNNYPGNDEICDGQDNDCDGLVDDSDPDVVATAYYLDMDMDGFGDPSESVVACTQPSGYVLDNTDCDDNDNNAYPGNTEICDGKDNNCDGVIDEGCGGSFDCDDDSLFIASIVQDSFHAQDYISSDAVIVNGEDILYTAGIDMDLINGFEVESGAIFEARIETCMTMRIAAEPIHNYTYLDKLMGDMSIDFDKKTDQKLSIRIINGMLDEVMRFESDYSKDELAQFIINRMSTLEKTGIYLLEFSDNNGQKELLKVFLVAD